MRNLKVALVVALLLVMCGFGVVNVVDSFHYRSAVLAEDAPSGGGEAPQPEGESTGPKARTMWTNIKACGLCGLVQILLSVVGFALAIEHAVNIRREKLIPPHILTELEQLFDEEEYEEAMDLCDQDDSFLCRIVGAGLARIGGGYERMMEAMQEVGEEEATSLHQKLSYISLIANLEPLLGLLGTVLGMIAAFNKISAMAGAANPADLADGISLALYTTAIGLIVAVPLIIIYSFFRMKIVKIVQEIGLVAGELMERFRPVE